MTEDECNAVVRLLSVTPSATLARASSSRSSTRLSLGSTVRRVCAMGVELHQRSSFRSYNISRTLGVSGCLSVLAYAIKFTMQCPKLHEMAVVLRRRDPVTLRNHRDWLVGPAGKPVSVSPTYQHVNDSTLCLRHVRPPSQTVFGSRTTWLPRPPFPSLASALAVVDLHAPLVFVFHVCVLLERVCFRWTGLGISLVCVYADGAHLHTGGWEA